MRIGAARRLTPAEIAIAAALFGEAARWADVRVRQAPPLGFGAMVPFGRAIVFSHWRAAEDFGATTLWEQGWFAHELTHVWQAARGIVLAAAKLPAIGGRAYRVRLEEGLDFDAHNIEGQAEIVRLLFLARAGLPQPYPRERLEHAFARGFRTARLRD